MNIEVPQVFLRRARADLPTPALTRWQPLRLGLVDLFRYDSEEFWFRDGHLLLRGNNGTGKSKVLSLTLPFLFDAQLKSSRIEPDGDPSKKMSWNLLLGKHDRRMGYAWVEFGRLAENGRPQYLTLGSGLSAAAARPHVDSWFFVLENRRVGLDIWLTNPQRVVLTKEKLKDALEEHGQVYETASSYRRAVDEHLFRLGPARFSSLIDTLIQLRQPQLSKKPDEGSLSEALTEALPPLSTELLGDVAEALNQLEEDRHQLEDYESLARAVGQFDKRYRLYAGTQTRRQARALRSAQTGYDNASRALNEARGELAAAEEAEAQAITRYEAAKSALRANRTRLQVLQSDPINQDANRLAAAAKEARDREQDVRQAKTVRGTVERRLEREVQATGERKERFRQAERLLARHRAAALDLARTVGIADLCGDNRLFSTEPVALVTLDRGSFDAANADLQHLALRRREQVELLDRQRVDLERAEQTREYKMRARDQAREETDAAAVRREHADRTMELQGRVFFDAWQNHFDRLRQLRVEGAQAVLESLAVWISTLHGNNPARTALQNAQQEASQLLARRHAELIGEQRILQIERATLQEERRQLELGQDPVPAIPPYRAIDARSDRPGAPLWQLVDFEEGVNEPQRAGLEAALEASGLLDAWVSPDGRLQPLDRAHPLHDTELIVRPRSISSLSSWLRPAGSDVDASIVSRLLQGVACGLVDESTAEAWVSPDGRFRLGALAGAWTKPVASYIGRDARAAARARRLDAIAVRLEQLGQELESFQAKISEHVEHQRQAAAEWKEAPADDPLRVAHVQAASSAREFQLVRARLEIAERELQEATERLSGMREGLARNSQDLHLPVTREELQAVNQALTGLVGELHGLFRAAHDLRQTDAEFRHQQQREHEARKDAEDSVTYLNEREAQAVEANVRLGTLRDLVGVKVEELQRRLRETEETVAKGEELHQDQEEKRRIAGESRAAGEQKVKAAHEALQERGTHRQHAIACLQGFAATGLLLAALPEADLPDLGTPWTIEPALNVARRAEQALSHVRDDDETWNRVRSQLSQDYTELGRTLGALGYQAQMDQTDYGLVVAIVYQNRPERPDHLAVRIEGEITQRRELLTAREREVLENHLQAEIAAAVQKLLQDADRQVDAINEELYKRPTTTGVRFRLQWQALPEGADGAPVGLEAARKRLLNTSTDLWSPEDRRVVGAMLQERIATERATADATGGGTMLEQLAKALDYRRWHRFSVQRWQDGQWRKLSGPASSGERALGLTVPLFAAVASYYSQSAYSHSPRLVLLDEAFAGIDDAARAHCMGLIREFDLDFVITSEREWGCYAELPGVSICHLQRKEGIDAVHVSRWTWDGRGRRPEEDPNRRFADT
jgi:uncharacterized protein (TIGR02680 family)